MADCGEAYIDCTNKNESVESLFKRLVSENEDGNLTLNICGCCSVFDFITLTPQETPPEGATEGSIYADTDHHLYYFNGTDWVQLDNEPQQ
jgi:hypothetical protein